MLLSRLLECPSPVNTPLCPAARPTSSAGLQGPDPTDQYGRRELTKPQWPLTSNMTMFTGPFHRACSAGKNRSQRENDCQKWRDLVGERLKRRNTSWVLFGLSYASSVFSFYLSCPHQLILKTQLLTFDLTTPSVCQFFLVNPIILKLVWFWVQTGIFQQKDTEFNKPSRPACPAHHVFLQDV